MNSSRGKILCNLEQLFLLEAIQNRLLNAENMASLLPLVPDETLLKTEVFQRNREYRNFQKKISCNKKKKSKVNVAEIKTNPGGIFAELLKKFLENKQNNF